MSPMIEKGHDKTNGGLWVAENAVSLPQRANKRSEKIPAGFSQEYHVLAELCASMSSGFMLLNPDERIAYSKVLIVRCAFCA